MITSEQPDRIEALEARVAELETIIESKSYWLGIEVEKRIALEGEVARLQAANIEMSDELTHRRENFETMLQRLLDAEQENVGLNVGLRENEGQRELDRTYYQMQIDRLQADVAALRAKLAHAPEEEK